MTTIVYRGVTYNREEHQKNHLTWWSYVHRATLLLCYRGIKYRPAATFCHPSVF